MSLKRWAKSAGSRCIRGVTIGRRLPLLAWLPGYSASLLVRDALAGLTVALMAVPQGMAYGQLAGLPPHFGLYACLLTGILYALLGTTDVVSIGPTAVMSLLTYEFAGGDPQRSVFLAFFTGAVVTAAGCFRLGFLVDFFSVPVVSGFVSAASITICSTQIKGLLGIKGSSGKTVIATLKHVFLHIKETNLWDLLLGVTCIVILLGLRRLGQHCQKKAKSSPSPSRRSRLVSGCLWLLGISRNAVVVLLASVLVLVLEQHQRHPFSTTNTVAIGFPTPQLPPFYSLVANVTVPNITPTSPNITSATSNITSNITNAAVNVINVNVTSTANRSGWSVVSRLTSELGLGLLIVPLVSVIECMAIAKAFAAHGRPQDHSQEMVALGVCNLLGSLLSSYTVTGSFSRTALNDASGAATPVAGVITCLFVMVALGSLTPYFRYIPTASLSAVIICAVFFMVEWRIVPELWRCRKPDLIPLMVTFLVGLFWRLEYGILLGTGVSLMLLLHRAARPKVTLTYRLTPGRRPYLLVLPDFGLNYPAAEHVRELIQTAAWSNAAPSEFEMTATSTEQSPPPPTGDASERDDDEEEQTKLTGDGRTVSTQNTARKNSSNDANGSGNGIIPIPEDPDIDTTLQTRDNISPPRENGADGDACHLIVSETDVVIKEGGSSSDLRHRRRRSTFGAIARESVPIPVILNCRNIRFTDFTAAKSLAAVAKYLQKEGGRPLTLLEVKPSVLAVWVGADSSAFVVSQSEAEAAQLIDQ